MQPREKILAAVVAGLLALLGVYVLGGRVLAAFNQRREQLATLKGVIREKEGLVARGKQAGRQLAEWETRSLPSDRELARTLYQNWLGRIVERAKLRDVNIAPGHGSMQKAYYKLP